MKLKKIYIEITNSCNFSCSYCFKSSRSLQFMSEDEFRVIATKIRPFTDYIYLHVLGEPLLHPNLDIILKTAADLNLKVNLTTNGSLIGKRQEILLRHKVRQINISLHDAEENIKPADWQNFLKTVFDFSAQASSDTYISLRLWNNGSHTSHAFNELCFTEISSHFNVEYDKLKNIADGESLKLSDRIFIQLASRFEWPDNTTSRNDDKRTCYALRDHIAVLANGDVIPCCLDADANLKLGNLFDQNLSEILSTHKAIAIKKGFEQGKIVEPFCRSCGFIINKI